MSDSVLEDVVALVQSNPHSGSSLLLYALVSTLRMEKGGHMFMLSKLRDLQPGHRRLAYGLMELMATGGNRGEEWEAALEAMDRALREHR